jgi:hypothetical protein
MQITQRQEEELERQLPKLVKHWKRIAQEIGRDGSKLPSSLDDFSREEAGRILDFLTTVRSMHEFSAKEYIGSFAPRTTDAFRTL